MKNTIQQLLLLGGIMVLFSNCEKEFFDKNNCGITDGPIVSQLVDISAIHSMDIKIPVELIIQESAVQEITLESNQSIIDAILDQSFVSNEEWNVTLDGCSNISSNSDGFPVKITVALPALQAIKVAGLGTARTDGIFKNIKNLKLEIEGAADFDFQLDSVQTLETKISGLGEFKLAGFTQNHQIDMSGSGDVKAFDLTTNNCTIKIDGLGECEVTVHESLEVKLSGSGKVCYKGTPSVNIDNQGNGQVNNCN